MKKFIFFVIIIGGAAIGYFKFFGREDTVNFRYGKILTTPIVEAIVATGTVEPEELVDVGTQVGGMILEFGKDADGRDIDYGSVVNNEMILAKIDDALCLIDMKQAAAQKLQAEAQKASAAAAVKQQTVNLHLTERNWHRATALKANAIISQAEIDNSASEYEKAQANLATAEAQVLQAEAATATAAANYDRAKRNLDYCIIKSPVDGVIIDRRVNVGQTVVSSMNASSLFLIAKDLKKMQIWVSVNEADIGNVRRGQEVEFSVDAFPNETFVGKVEKIRLNASMSQNVVSYIVEVATDNRSGRLLPYLTANVNFILNRSGAGTLSVPNAAWRYQPEINLIKAEHRELWEKSGELDRGKNGIVWVMRNNELTPLAVTIGISDGTRSEIVSGDLKADDQIVTGINSGRTQFSAGTGGNSGGERGGNANNAANNPERSPFVPQMPTRRGGGGGRPPM